MPTLTGFPRSSSTHTPGVLGGMLFHAESMSRSMASPMA